MTKLKWALGGVAATAALLVAVPAMKKRTMRVTAILKKDHRVVNGLIVTLQKTPRANSKIRETLFEKIRANVLVHAQAEEEVLYPTLKTLVSVDGQSKVHEAYREHQIVKDLLNDLRTIEPLSDSFDKKFAAFKTKLDDHVTEEEGELFPLLTEQMSTKELEALGERIQDRKTHLKSTFAA